MNCHTSACQRVGHCVDTAAAGQHISASPAVQNVVAPFAKQRVATAAAQQDVIAGTAGQRLVGGRPGDGVGKAGAKHPLNGDQPVTVCIAANACTTVQRQDYPGQRKRVDSRVKACATIYRVAAGATGENIVPGIALQHIAARHARKPVIAQTTDKGLTAAAAGNDIIKGRANNFFNGSQHIALRLAARPGRTVHGDLDAGEGGGVVCPVLSVTAIDQVSAKAANDQVITCLAAQGVATIAARQPVVAGATIKALSCCSAGQIIRFARTGQPFDGGQGVTLRITAKTSAREQVDRHPGHAGRIVRMVKARSPGQYVRTCATDQRVITSATQQRVIARQTGDPVGASATFNGIGIDRATQNIVKRRAKQTLDLRQRIAGSITSRARQTVKSDAHFSGRYAVVSRVKPGPANQCVNAGAAHQTVITRTAVKRLSRKAAGQHVIQRRADQPLDIAQRITLRIAAQTRAGEQRHLNTSRRGRIGDSVKASAAKQRICPAKACQRVIAVIAFQRFIRRRTRHLVAKRRPQNPLNAGQPVALCRPARAGYTVQPHVHRA